jgi:hypothetical protein
LPTAVFRRKPKADPDICRHLPTLFRANGAFSRQQTRQKIFRPIIRLHAVAGLFEASQKNRCKYQVI